MNRPSIHPNYAFWAVYALLVCLILIQATVLGEVGKIAADDDDSMRLMQIRDFYLGGQSWFDTTQYRMGSIDGTPMHWSRLADIPVLVLIGIFDLFLPYATAEAIAISLWPPLSTGLVLGGVFTGAKNLGGVRAGWWALIITAIFMLTHYRFAPGAIDHHNLQIGLLSLAIGFAIDPNCSPKSLLISGICLGLSFAVGADIYILGAAISGFVALHWLTKGKSTQKGIIAFSIGLAATLSISFLAVIPPSNYYDIHCDALSFITVATGVTGSLGLALNAKFLSGTSIKIRLTGLIVLAIICAMLLLLQAPQCLTNPLSDLPVEVKKLWLENIIEAQPLLANPETRWTLAPAALGGTFVAAIISLFKISKTKNPVPYGLFLGLFVILAGLSLYQIRFYVFAQVFSLIVLGAWIAELHAKKTERPDKVHLAYIGALTLAVPAFWALPGILFSPEPEPDFENSLQKAKNCYSEEVLGYMKSLPKGRFVTTENGTPHILRETHHSGLSGNYHRNVNGIAKTIQIFAGDNSLENLAQEQIDYVHFCSATGESETLKNHNPDGLMGQLMDGEIPGYLTPLKTLEDGTVTIFKVTQR